MWRSIGSLGRENLSHNANLSIRFGWNTPVPTKPHVVRSVKNIIQTRSSEHEHILQLFGDCDKSQLHNNMLLSTQFSTDSVAMATMCHSTLILTQFGKNATSRVVYKKRNCVSWKYLEILDDIVEWYQWDLCRVCGLYKAFKCVSFVLISLRIEKLMHNIPLSCRLRQIQIHSL